MNYYLDTSVLVALILPDAHSQSADAWLTKVNPTLVTSDFCTIEFAAVVSRRVRMNNLSVPTANLALRTLDGWLARTAQVVPCAPHHMALAAALVRDFPTKLMAPDAIQSRYDEDSRRNDRNFRRPLGRSCAATRRGDC